MVAANREVPEVPMASRVNEKLYHTQLLLTQAAAAEGMLRRALAEGALFHLVTGYRAVLGEIAGPAAGAAPIDARQLMRELEQSGGQQAIPGISELAALEQAGQWPAQMLRVWQTVTALQGNGQAAGSGTAGLSLVQLADEADVDAIAGWLGALQAFIEAQRELLQEW